MKLLRQIPLLLIASTLAVIGLVVFQLKWMRHSRELSEEIFNQRVCMAVCATVEDYGGGMLCTKTAAQPSCHSGVAVANSAVELASDSAFHSSLRQSLDFYQIGLDYSLSFTADSVQEPCSKGIYQCQVPLPVDSTAQTAFMQVNFPDRQSFMLEKMHFMVTATILILLFTAAVLLFANWSLLKQKRLLETNMDFFNNMAHEFRTPLTNVGLAVNMLGKKHQELKENPFVDIVRRENARLQAQVERVLHLARVENGDYSLQKEHLNLKSLLASVCHDMAMQIERSGATVSLDEAPDSYEVYGDRLHLSNVFRNLLDNALKYACEKPLICISAQEHRRGILIQVQDNGVGIPASQCELIFEKFQRAGQGDLHEQKGFGLGLAYVKSMVELHKGFVRVFSEVNKGSRFEVYLPFISPQS
jgi:signal transduction histidine kinase